MDMSKVIERINFLYKKSKTEGLTEEEKKEQANVRRIYIDAVKENLRCQLDRIKIVGNGKGCRHEGHSSF